MRILAILTLALLPVAASAAAPPEMAAAEEAVTAWDIPEAATLAEELRRRAPDDPDVAYLLGRVRMHQGRYDDAVALFTEAGARNDPDTYLQVARASARVTRHYAKVESDHFVFRFAPGKDEILAPYALETLERAFDRNGEALGYRPKGDKIRVEVVGDTEELADLSTLSIEAIKKTGTIAICKFDKLIITSPRALLEGYDWRDTLAHELTHLLITRKTRNRTPIWIHEGIAKYFETAWRGQPGLALEAPSWALLRDAVKSNKLISFERMHPSIALLPTVRDAALAFAEVFTVVEFLQSKDAGSTSRLLDLLGTGKDDPNAAVAAVYGAPFAQFSQAWLKWLKTRKYPEGPVSMERLLLMFKDDPDAPDKVADGTGYRDLSTRGAFGDIDDAQARRAAHLGELLRARGKVAAAVAKYREAIDRVGGVYPALSNKYAIALRQLDHGAEAMQVLEAARRLYPMDPLTNLNLARVSLDQGKAAEAQIFLENSLSVNAFDPEIHAMLVEVARQRGDEVLLKRATRARALLSGKDVSPTDEAPLQAVGWLAVESDVVARVLVDGNDSGLTTPVARLPLGSGRHRIRLERMDAPGFKDFEVEIQPGETSDLRAALVGS